MECSFKDPKFEYCKLVNDGSRCSNYPKCEIKRDKLLKHMKCKIIVLQGVPASGKSTYARQVAENNSDYVIVSRDSIRESRGIYWIPDQENYISDIEEFEVRSAIKHDLIPIIDATNLNPKTIEKWNKIAEELEVPIEFKKFEITYQEALDRDKERAKNGERSVGKKTLDIFFTKYFPELIGDSRLMKPIEGKKRQVVLCDLDGTLAIHTGRNPFDYSKIPTDKIDERLKSVLKHLNYDIIFVSGREGTDECRKLTERWLAYNFGGEISLKMRRKGDFRPDEVVKAEIYHNEIEPYYEVIAVFDDRDKVVKMWRDLGILCCQVYYGDF